LFKTHIPLPADQVAGSELHREADAAPPGAAQTHGWRRERMAYALRSALRPHKLAWSLGLAALVILCALDRGYWAEVAQWREDQACNLWLGYTQSLLELPIGLISSVGAPNPNGMPLLAAVLSLLPNLWAISTALGLIQGLLVLRIAWLVAGPRLLFWLLALPALASVVLRATSVEFWNQWLLTSMNLAFFACWISYLRRPSPWPVVGFLWTILYAPAIYLAGAVNAFAYLVFAGAALWLRPLRWNPRRRPAPAVAALLLLVFALLVTWIPYLRESSNSVQAVPPLTAKGALERLQHALEALLEYPRWVVTHWFDATLDSYLQSSDRIIGRRMVKSVRRMEALVLCQAALSVAALLVAIGNWMRERPPGASFFRDGRLPGRTIIGCLTFPLVSIVVSPLLGGPDWTSGDRSDQQVQFLPFLLFAWFALPFVLTLPMKLGWAMRGVTCALLLAFCGVSVRDGLATVDAHLQYRGNALTLADVPLAQQRAAVEFIARDWMATSPGDTKIPVAYQHGQDWVTKFGEKLKRWYPAPMTVGRALDFELKRVYGLSNTQEGVQARTIKGARYVVTYAFRRAPRVRGAVARHAQIGRLRVSIFSTPPR
jgi:hypothetical protein